MRGELVAPPRLVNPRIPRELNDIVLRAMAPDISARYQRAGDLLDELLAARDRWVAAGRTPRPAARPGRGPAAVPSAGDDLHDIHNRVRAREAPQPRFCWHCRKPLHARSARCPFCGEAQ
jgi:hypothetical protein